MPRPSRLLAAALVFGIALGFGSAFVGEMRHPRVSDEHELERMTGARVLATVRPRPRNPDRQRRSADRNAPPYFDPGADGYQLTYLHVARAGASRLTLTLTGEDTGNRRGRRGRTSRRSPRMRREARSSSTPIRARRPSPRRCGSTPSRGSATSWIGTSTGPRSRRRRWSAATERSTSCRAAFVGGRTRPSEVTELFRREAARLARHYEAIVIVAPLEQAKAGLPGALPIPDTILCARVGHTRIARLAVGPRRNSRRRRNSAWRRPLGCARRRRSPTPERIARRATPARHTGHAGADAIALD